MSIFESAIVSIVDRCIVDRCNVSIP
jgi:hypothetical protein